MSMIDHSTICGIKFHTTVDGTAIKHIGSNYSYVSIRSYDYAEGLCYSGTIAGSRAIPSGARYHIDSRNFHYSQDSVLIYLCEEYLKLINSGHKFQDYDLIMQELKPAFDLCTIKDILE